ncbi:Rha family transcriptional regulator [Xanthomonas campestris]|uniref:Rha family transcriptional regulator n=1 Tax=Xanthomonas campestris TaxID=339 RepID=UPI002367CED7|nr:Rha family transcriptional regulator [Xanthomonas campestris]WDI91917.1 Rha family transcriptional regulator [Xanthomonas campestris]
MNGLVKVGAGEPRVDTRDLAAQLDLRHQNVFETVKAYKTDFEELGILRFQTGEISGRGRPERFAMLTEDQCYLLLTYSRNTDRVRQLKLSLVKAFKEVRETRRVVEVEYLPAYHQLHDEIHRLAAGSPNERFVHMNTNKLINKAAGLEAGTRGKANLPQLATVTVMQQVAASAFHRANDHRDGYQAMKSGIAALCGLLEGPKEAA